MTPRIIVADDDESIRSTLTHHLRTYGYEVTAAADGIDAVERFHSTKPDLVITDLAMPHADGFAVIETVRASGATPVIVLSVRGGDVDKVRALDLGADDYVTKPFSVPELLARVRAQLRRTAGQDERLVFSDLSIDVEKRRVVQNGRDVRLTPTEFLILVLLARNAGRRIGFDQIIASVWIGASGTTNDAVRVHVGALRRKIEPDASNPRYIVTEPWIGYRFIAEPLA